MELASLLSTNEVVAQIISFLILFLLLRALAWKRVLRILDERRQRIASEFKKIEDAKSEVARLKSEYEVRLGEIEKAARVRMQEVLDEGERLAQEVKENAQREAGRIIENAKQEARREVVKAKEELKDEIVDLVLDATGRLLEEKMTDERDKQMARDFIDRIDQLE
jgi:F-type H+-transporting ATPase subunit b